MIVVVVVVVVGSGCYCIVVIVVAVMVCIEGFVVNGDFDALGQIVVVSVEIALESPLNVHLQARRSH